MLVKVLLTTEEVAAAVTDYLNVRQPELMKEFRISEVYDEKLSYSKLLRVTLSNEPVVEADEGEEAE